MTPRRRRSNKPTSLEEALEQDDSLRTFEAELATAEAKIAEIEDGTRHRSEDAFRRNQREALAGFATRRRAEITAAWLDEHPPPPPDFMVKIHLDTYGYASEILACTSELERYSVQERWAKRSPRVAGTPPSLLEHELRTSRKFLEDHGIPLPEPAAAA